MIPFSRKLIFAAAALAVLLCASALLPAGSGWLALADGQNLVTNGTFEQNDGETPAGWEPNSWDNEQGFTSFSVDASGGADGSAAACIENVEINDSRFMQDVTVRKNTLYRLSGDIRVEGGDGTWGATLSFKDTFVHTEPLFDTQGQWKHVEIYARSGASQTKTTVFARVGGYGSTCHGKAWFDNIVLEEVQSLPSGAAETSMATNSGGSSGAAQTKENQYLPLIMFVAFAFIAAMLVCFRRMRGAGGADENRKPDWQFLAVAGAIALLLRAALAVMVRGYPNDIDCWLGWSSQAATGGLFNMYKSAGFNDYPPGYMYVLWIVGQINRLLPATNLQLLMVKMPSIIADLATGYIIYRMALKRVDSREAVTLSLLYVFNPLVLLDSSAWGQIDSILALIVVGCFWQVYQKRMVLAAVFYGVGVLVKPQMLLFAPAMLGALIVAGRQAGSFGRGAMVWLKTLGAGLATLVLLALPFWIVQGDPMWLINQYAGTFGTYKNATINACNLAALFGGNWVDDSQKIFGMPYYIWGYAGMGLVSLFTLWAIVFRDRDNRRIFLWAALLIAGIFVLGTRMHERYMYPAVALLLVYYVLERDRRALYLFGLFSITQFMNAAIVLANHDMSIDVIRSGDVIAIANPDGMGIWVILISLVAAASLGYMIYAALKADRPLAGTGIDPEELRQNRFGRIADDLAVTPAASSIPMARKDWLIMGAMTLAYAVLAYVYLGTTNVPKTYWHGALSDDYAVIDLGESKYVAQIEHYDSLTKGNLQISTSDDGVEWTDQTELVHKAVETGQKDDLGIYSWTLTDADFSARYIKLTVTVPPVRMLEFVLRDADGNVIKPAGISDAMSKDKTKEEALAGAACLIDEPQAVPVRPSFYNSMYFDEIYHARTGWEFTQGNIVPYENTHPPLGKDLIALGILIFGMDPFGWRFMGTLMGVLMVPAMYLFGMAVFKKTRYAFIATFLMTFDFMHFVQTRIATIDSYSVLFIILTFLCMYLYLHTNFNTQKLRKTFLPLALSGIFFGLASASKWIGLYAGAGLAVMFFYSLYRRWKEYDAVRFGDVEVDEQTREGILRGFWKKLVLTVLWCGLFFVAVAGVIYFASYIPFNIGSSGGKPGSWDAFIYAWNNQSSMYNYHSNLVDNHPFRSAWYQWPFIIKPMFFYKDYWLPAGWMGSIATFGNPAVWWVGTAAMVWLVLRIYRSHKFELPEMFVLGGFLTEYLPWVLVPRTMFIYHYFASVPFFIIAIVLYIRQWENTPAPKDPNSGMQLVFLLAAALVVSVFMSLMLTCILAVLLIIAMAMHRKRNELDLYKRDLTHVYLAVVLALFILFYPVLSGLPIPSWYGALLKWMPTWWFTY